MLGPADRSDQRVRHSPFIDGHEFATSGIGTWVTAVIPSTRKAVTRIQSIPHPAGRPPGSPVSTA